MYFPLHQHQRMKIVGSHFLCIKVFQIFISVSMLPILEISGSKLLNKEYWTYKRKNSYANIFRIGDSTFP